MGSHQSGLLRQIRVPRRHVNTVVVVVSVLYIVIQYYVFLYLLIKMYIFLMYFVFHHIRNLRIRFSHNRNFRIRFSHIRNLRIRFSHNRDGPFLAAMPSRHTAHAGPVLGFRLNKSDHRSALIKSTKKSDPGMALIEGTK